MNMGHFVYFVFDPVVIHAVAAAISILLITGAISKLRDLELFRYVVENYGLLSGKSIGLFATLFPVLELLAGLALIPESTRAIGACLSLVVMLISTAGVVLNLWRGRTRLECGCGTGAQRISWGLVVRNLLLSVAILLAAAPELSRPLGFIDYFSVACALLALLALYASANQMLANQPLLKELQS